VFFYPDESGAVIVRMNCKSCQTLYYLLFIASEVGEKYLAMFISSKYKFI